MAAALKLPTTLSWRFGLLVLLLAALSLAIGTQAAIDTNANTRCLAQYSKAQADVSSARSTATAAKDAAVAAFLGDIARVLRKPTPDALDQLRASSIAYKSATAQLQRERAANPLPEFPQECSQVNE